jgi:hypothetical protein
MINRKARTIIQQLFNKPEKEYLLYIWDQMEYYTILRVTKYKLYLNTIVKYYCPYYKVYARMSSNLLVKLSRTQG